MSGPEGQNPGRERGITTPTHTPCPTDLLPRGLGTSTPDALDQPERPMPDFNLGAMSLADLRDLQKSVAKAIFTFEARQRAEAREKVEMLARDLGFTLAELAELEEPKRKRAPPTKIYRHPENPALTWSERGPKPGWFAAHVDAGKNSEELLS
jgi:DNA-binding protein H-NS